MPGFLNLVAHFLVQTVLSADVRRRDPGGVRAEKDKCQKGMWDTNISSTVLEAIVGMVQGPGAHIKHCLPQFWVNSLGG